MMEIASAKAIILDMYGVIIEQTGDDFVPFVRRTFPEKSEAEIYEPWLLAEVGKLPSSLEIWSRIGFTGDLRAVEVDYLDTLRIQKGLFDFISDAETKFRLAIISNDCSGWSRYLREKFDVDRHFDVVSISGDLGMKKPDERIFRLTADKLGVAACDCVFVDDRKRNLYAAAKLGMMPILFGSDPDYSGIKIDGFDKLGRLLMPK